MPKAKSNKTTKELGFRNREQQVAFESAKRNFHEKLSNIQNTKEKLTENNVRLLPLLCVGNWKWEKCEGKWKNSILNQPIVDLKGFFEIAVKNNPKPPDPGLFQHFKKIITEKAKNLLDKTNQEKKLSANELRAEIFKEIQNYQSFDFAKRFPEVEFGDEAKWFVCMLQTFIDHTNKSTDVLEALLADELWGYKETKNATNAPSSGQLIQSLWVTIYDETKKYSKWVSEKNEKEKEQRIEQEKRKLSIILKKQEERQKIDERITKQGYAIAEWDKCIDIIDELMKLTQNEKSSPYQDEKISEKISEIKFPNTNLGTIKIGIKVKEYEDITMLLKTIKKEIYTLKSDFKKLEYNKKNNKDKYEKYVDDCKEKIMEAFQLEKELEKEEEAKIEKICKYLKEVQYPGNKNSNKRSTPWKLAWELLRLHANLSSVKQEMISVAKQQSNAPKKTFFTKLKTFLTKVNKDPLVEKFYQLQKLYIELYDEINKVEKRLEESANTIRNEYKETWESLLQRKGDILNTLGQYKQKCEDKKNGNERSRFNLRKKLNQYE